MMPQKIHPGEAVRRDADSLARIVADFAASPDFGAAAAIPYDHGAHLAHLENEWRAGRIHAANFRRAGVVVGQVFYAVEGDRFRIHGGHSLPSAVTNADFCEVMAFLETEARRLGCKAITTDTSRPGVLRAHLAQGYKVAEVIMTKAL